MIRWRVYDAETGDSLVFEWPDGSDAVRVAEAYVAEECNPGDGEPYTVWVQHPDGAVSRCVVTTRVTTDTRSTGNFVADVPHHVWDALKEIR